MFPLSLEAKLIAGALALAALIAWLGMLVHSHDAEVSAKATAPYIEQHAKDLDVARVKEAKILADQSEAIREADKFNLQAALGAEHAVRSGDGVQHRFDAINARCVPDHPAASAPGAAASDAADLRADVFRRIRQAAGQLAATADAAHGAGQLAADSYDALKDTK